MVVSLGRARLPVEPVAAPRPGAEGTGSDGDLGTGAAAAALALIATVAGASLFVVILAGRSDSDRAFSRRGDQRPALESTAREVEAVAADDSDPAPVGSSLDQVLLAEVGALSADLEDLDTEGAGRDDPEARSPASAVRNPTTAAGASAGAVSRVDDRSRVDVEEAPASVPEPNANPSEEDLVPTVEDDIGTTELGTDGEPATTAAGAEAVGGEATSVAATVAATVSSPVPPDPDAGVEEGPLLTNEALAGPAPQAQSDQAASADEREPPEAMTPDEAGVGGTTSDDERPTLVLIESPDEPDRRPAIDRLILIADGESATLQWGYAGAETDIGGFVVSWTSGEGETGQITVADASRRSITLTELASGSDYTIDLAVLSEGLDVDPSTQLSGRIQVG